jgi:hypothetical protein
VKVEKVVKPPKTPTKTKSRNSSLPQFLTPKKASKKPIKKHPKILTRNVPLGNPEAGNFDSTNADNTYLDEAPRKPPAPTAHIFKKSICT